MVCRLRWPTFGKLRKQIRGLAFDDHAPRPDGRERQCKVLLTDTHRHLITALFERGRLAFIELDHVEHVKELKETLLQSFPLELGSDARLTHGGHGVTVWMVPLYLCWFKHAHQVDEHDAHLLTIERFGIASLSDKIFSGVVCSS